MDPQSVAAQVVISGLIMVYFDTDLMSMFCMADYMNQDRASLQRQGGHYRSGLRFEGAFLAQDVLLSITLRNKLSLLGYSCSIYRDPFSVCVLHLTLSHIKFQHQNCFWEIWHVYHSHEFFKHIIGLPPQPACPRSSPTSVVVPIVDVGTCDNVSQQDQSPLVWIQHSIPSLPHQQHGSDRLSNRPSIPNQRATHTRPCSGMGHLSVRNNIKIYFKNTSHNKSLKVSNYGRYGYMWICILRPDKKYGYGKWSI